MSSDGGFLAEAVVESGGEVVGPFARVEFALAILSVEPPHAAILDVRLIDGDVVAVARAFPRNGTPVRFHTVSAAAEAFLSEFGPAPILPKPASVNQFVHVLASIVAATS